MTIMAVSTTTSTISTQLNNANTENSEEEFENTELLNTKDKDLEQQELFIKSGRKSKDGGKKRSYDR